MTPNESSSVIEPRGTSGDAGPTVVSLHGEHDFATSTALSQTLSEAIARDDADLLVDLSDVSFMSAATVEVFIRARRFLGPLCRTLMLRDPSPSAMRILLLCGLTHLVDGQNPPVLSGARAVSGALGTWVTVPATKPTGGGAGSDPNVQPARESVRIRARTAAAETAGEPSGRSRPHGIPGTGDSLEG